MKWLRCGAVLAAVGVIAGALGAHGLARQLAETGHAEHWKTAVQYLFAVIPGLLACALVQAPKACAPSLFAGAMIFSGSLFAICLGGPSWLGAITPVGGLLMILGYILLAFSRRKA